MSKEHTDDVQSAALRLRCIKVLTDLDDESLRIVDSVLGRLLPTAPKQRAKRALHDPARPATPAGVELKGGAK